MKCSKCQKEINNNARFCRFCGSPVEMPKGEQGEKKKCPQCSADVGDNAKFCRSCGYKIIENDTSSTKTESTVFVESNYITWHILPGQLAVKIEEKDIAGYGNVKGLYVTPGTKALFFINGRFVTVLESGKYKFNELIQSESEETDKSEKEDTKQKKRATVLSFLRNVAGHIKDGIASLFGRQNTARDRTTGEKAFYTIVLVRGDEFPLLFAVKNVSTANIRCEIGLHIRCRLTDYNGLFSTHLVDNKFIGFEMLAEHLYPTVKTVLDYELSSVSPQDVQNNNALTANVLNTLKERFDAVYSYFEVKNIISLTSAQEDMENIRRLQEELYVAEQELSQAQLREDFLNKMQNAEYNNTFRSARSKLDFIAMMDKLDEERMLNDDKKEQFALMLNSQRILREATTKVEMDNAIDGLVKSRMLSTEEIDILKRQISHRAEMSEYADAQELTMAEIDGAQAIAMATLLNNEALDREALNWELEIGNKRFENQLDRQRALDDYADRRRESDFDYEKRKTNNKMDLLRQAQALREEREQAQHQRNIESRKLEIDNDIEKAKITAGMTFEQIVATNPNVSPEVARALAEKFKADALSNQNAQKDEMYRMMLEMQKQSNEQMTAMQQRNNDQITNLFAQQINAQAQTNAHIVDEKQRELNRVHSDAERHQDRMLQGMQTTVNAFSNNNQPVNKQTDNMQSNSNTKLVETVFCPVCGTKQPNENTVCSFCGCKIDEQDS